MLAPQRDVGSGSHEPGISVKNGRQSPCDQQGRFLRSLRQENHELVASVPKRRVHQPQIVTKRLSHLPQQFAANQMSILIIDVLEVVEIQKQQAEFVTEALRAVNLLGKHRKQMARIVQASAIVGDAELLNALNSASVLNGNCGVVGESLEQNLVAGIDLHVDTDQLDNAQHLATCPDRHADHGTSIGEETVILAAALHARVPVDISDHKRLSVPGDPFCEGFAGFQCENINSLARLANRGRIIEFLAGFIEQ